MNVIEGSFGQKDDKHPNEVYANMAEQVSDFAEMLEEIPAGPIVLTAAVGDRVIVLSFPPSPEAAIFLMEKGRTAIMLSGANLSTEEPIDE